jgi:hypothetical protein
MVIVQVERVRTGAPGAGLQLTARGDDEAETRHALDAFVGAADQKVDAQSVHVNRHSTKRTHGVDDVHATVLAHHLADRFDGIQHSRCGLAVHHCHVRNRRIVGQLPR